jgi:multidrug transporter EmrE-like cation transporter
MNLLLIIVSVLLNCSAQLLIRKGMIQVGEVSIASIFQTIIPMLSNFYLWIALLLYGISFLMWAAVLSRVEVSFAYPFLSIGYVVTTIVGYYYFHESLNITRIAGIMVICVGVYLISRS